MRMDSLKPLAIGAYLLAFVVTLSPPADATLDRGVVVEEVTRGYAGHAAGLQPGDVIVSWSREANPPANPQAAHGAIKTPFDLAEVEIEQAPRGPVTLVGSRAGVPSSWAVPQDEWQLKTRPPFSGPQGELYAEGRRLVEAKRVRDGVERWRLGARAAQESQGLLAAWLSLRAAEALSESRDWGPADELYAETDRILEQQVAAVRSQVLRAWGASLLYRRRWEEARGRIREALAWEQARNSESLAVARTEYLLARVALDANQYMEADTHCRRALLLQERHAPQSAAVADSLSEWANLELYRGNLDAASEHTRQARAAREATAVASVALANDITRSGWIAFERGDLGSAADGFSQALKQLEQQAPESPSTAFALAGMGSVRVRGADFSAAETYLRRALELYERINPDGTAQGSVLVSLGTAARYRRDLEMARSHYQKAVALFESANPAHAAYTVALHSLGDVALDREDFGSAELHYRKALEITEERVGADAVATAFDLHCLARALAGEGRFDSAQEMAERSLEIRERQLSPGSYEIGQSLTTLAEIALARGDLGASLKRHRQALAIRSRMVPGSAFEAESLYGVGRIHRRQGRLISAVESLAGAVEALEQQGTRLGGGEEARANFGAGYTPYYREFLEVLLELGRPAEAFHALERSRARALLAMLAERRTLLADELAPELVQERQANHDAYDQIQTDLSRLNPGKDDAEIERLRDRLRELRDDAAHIGEKVRQASPRVASLEYPKPVDLAGARATLDQGSTLLSFSVGENETSLFAVHAAGKRGSGMEVFTLSIGRRALREKVERFRRLIECADQSSLLDEAAKLYDLLMRPAESALAGSERLVISPEGPLHVLPFAALLRMNGGTRQYLLEWKPLHIVASATVYAEIKKTRLKVSPNEGIALVAFGDPRYPPAKPANEEMKDVEMRRFHERGVALSPLPSTREEIKGITAVYGARARGFLGKDATEERVKMVAKDARYIHIASHGVLDEVLPLNSGLALTIPEKPEPGKDNGLLQAWEIFDGLRIDADLVTLSACKTALGKDLGGEGLLGLTRAFQYAGARSVLASLWSVADRSTAKLMRRFYGHLAAGKSKDEALRAAQVEMLGSGGAASHPRHWAAFELFGDWR